MPMQDFENLLMRYGCEPALRKNCADCLAIRPGAPFQRMDDGKRGLALAEVGGRGLAKPVFIGSQVQDVVDDLKREAEVASIFAQGLFKGSLVEVSIRGGQHGTELHRHLEEAGRLAIDEVEVLFLVDEVAELLHLQQLALDHLLRERDEQIKDPEVALRKRRLEGLHIEPVASEDALCVAPCGVR